jgi:hypothetical protein
MAAEVQDTQPVDGMAESVDRPPEEAVSGWDLKAFAGVLDERAWPDTVEIAQGH